ncbi:MAG: hypothetical protein M3387_00710 [Actinomycetota bacterium]|nr:hypothetical protein [Actinomycetota bacterium]
MRADRWLAVVEEGMTTPEIDAVLDVLNSVARIVFGHLMAEDVPRLNAQLTDVFEAFTLRLKAERITVDPKLAESACRTMSRGSSSTS